METTALLSDSESYVLSQHANPNSIVSITDTQDKWLWENTSTWSKRTGFIQTGSQDLIGRFEMVEDFIAKRKWTRRTFSENTTYFDECLRWYRDTKIK